MARRRRRDNAGSSEMSWKKHQLLQRVARGQAHAFRQTHPQARCLIIDMHAGTGEGITLPQLDFFAPAVSVPSAAIAVSLAQELGQTDVILCEKQRSKRQQLLARFPEATILKDHQDLMGVRLDDYGWALVFNDPCGYGSHGVEVLQHIAREIRSDSIVIFNEGALNRLLGMHEIPEEPDPPHVAAIRHRRQHYAWMIQPKSWALQLGMRQVARSCLITATPGFRYRLLVVSRAFCDYIRPPLWEKLTAWTS